MARLTDHDLGFRLGTALAAAYVMRNRDQPVIACEILAEAGLTTLARIKPLDLAEFDMKPLRACLRQLR